MTQKLFSSSKSNVKKKTNDLIKINVSASKLTKGGGGHIPEYFVGPNTPVIFYD